VGYHNEHHDFPSVAWTNLPALREIAKEFYEPLPSHESWPYVTWKFITDPKVGMWSRVKRTGKGERIDERVWRELAIGTDTALESEAEEVQTGMVEAEDIAYASDTEMAKGKRD